MVSKLTNVVLPIALGVVAACRGPAVSPSTNAAPSSNPMPLTTAAPSSSSSQASPLPEPPPKDPPTTSKPACPAEEPTVNAEFVSVKLELEPSEGGGMNGTAEVWGKLPAISKDGRTLAILDKRLTDEGTTLFLLLQDVRTNKRTVFVLWTDTTRKVRLKEAQAVLDKTTWQTLIPGKIGEDPCASGTNKVDPKALRFKTTEFRFGAENYAVKLTQRTGSTEKTFDLKVRNLPGIMGEAAVPTNDVGGNCGAWAFLVNGWVSQDNKVYLFELGAFLGGRCGTAHTPMEHFVWSPR